MSALQQDQVGTAVLAHRASPMGFLSPAFEPIDLEERLQIDNCSGRTQTGPSGNFCHLCSFQEKQILQAEEFPAFHSQGISPPPLSFFSIKVEGSLSATFANCRGRNRTLGCFPFSFYLLSPQRGCTAARNKHRHTGAFDPPTPFFPSRPSRMDSLSALGN